MDRREIAIQACRVSTHPGATPPRKITPKAGQMRPVSNEPWLVDDRPAVRAVLPPGIVRLSRLADRETEPGKVHRDAFWDAAYEICAIGPDCSKCLISRDKPGRLR